MMNFRRSYGTERIVFLLAILLCLCTSRGEGLHLLPFAAVSDTASLEALVGDEVPGTYQLAKTPEESISLSFQASDRAVHSTGFCPGVFTFDNASIRLIRVGPENPGYFPPPASPSKFLLTASSDRSPPLS